jgi:hypothetical protein
MYSTLQLGTQSHHPNSTLILISLSAEAKQIYNVQNCVTPASLTAVTVMAIQILHSYPIRLFLPSLSPPGFEIPGDKDCDSLIKGKAYDQRMFSRD